MDGELLLITKKIRDISSMWIELSNFVYGNNRNITTHEQNTLTQHISSQYSISILPENVRKLGH